MRLPPALVPGLAVALAVVAVLADRALLGQAQAARAAAVASNGGARVEVEGGVGGRVTLPLERVPWDQAFDVLAVVNALTWTRTGAPARLVALIHETTLAD